MELDPTACRRFSGSEVRMKRGFLFLTITMAGWVLGGCTNDGRLNASSSQIVSAPLAGIWTGKSDMKGNDLDKLANSWAGGPLTGASSLTLNPDTTGFLKVADQPERPIS